MIIIRAFKVELDPNNKQRTNLVKHAGAKRFAWNWGLARRIEEYKTTGKISSSYVRQNRQLNALKKTEFPWMYEVSKCVVEGALADLDMAYQYFFRGLKIGESIGLPHFKSKKDRTCSFRLKGSIHVFDKLIQLPRLGNIRLKEHNYVPTEGIKILSATCSEKAGRWFVSVNCEANIPDPIQPTGTPIGIDLGIKTRAVCSDGQEFANLRPSYVLNKKMVRLQREFSRRKKGSHNREKSKYKVARLHVHITNIRQDAIHKATSSIIAKTKLPSERPSAIVLEDLNLEGMVKNHKLARSIRDVGMYKFRRQIEYKAAWSGIQVMLANTFFPSSKACSVCGLINDHLTLSDRDWTCECGQHHDRDMNAAINLANLVKQNTVSSTGINACRENVRLGIETNIKQSRRSRNQFLNPVGGGL